MTRFPIGQNIKYIYIYILLLKKTQVNSHYDIIRQEKTSWKVQGSKSRKICILPIMMRGHLRKTREEELILEIVLKKQVLTI
jgi:hypothetical protein